MEKTKLLFCFVRYEEKCSGDPSGRLGSHPSGGGQEKPGVPSQPGVPGSCRQHDEILVKQMGYLPSEHPLCKRRALPLLRSGAEVPLGEPQGAAEALTSMTSTSALVKSMFSSLGRGTPAPSTPVGHKPAQLSATGGGVTAELLPGARSPTPSSLCATPPSASARLSGKALCRGA